MRIILILLCLSLASPVHAETCESVLSKCETAVNALEQQTQLQKQIMADQQQLINLRTQQLNDEREKLNAWYRDPLVVGATSSLLTVILLSLTGAFGK